MWYATHLYQEGIISATQFADAAVEQISRRPTLGEIAIRRGRLTIKQAMQILFVQSDDMEKPFGRVAVDLGLLSEAEVAELLVDQAKSVPHLGEILVEQGVLTQQDMLDELNRMRQSYGNSESQSKVVHAHE